jgi:hypothetical protein
MQTILQQIPLVLAIHIFSPNLFSSPLCIFHPLCALPRSEQNASFNAYYCLPSLKTALFAEKTRMNIFLLICSKVTLAEKPSFLYSLCQCHLATLSLFVALPRWHPSITQSRQKTIWRARRRIGFVRDKHCRHNAKVLLAYSGMIRKKKPFLYPLNCSNFCPSSHGNPESDFIYRLATLGRAAVRWEKEAKANEQEISINICNSVFHEICAFLCVKWTGKKHLYSSTVGALSGRV